MVMLGFEVVFAIVSVLVVACLIQVTGRVAGGRTVHARERANEMQSRKRIGSVFFVAILVISVFAAIPFTAASPNVTYVPDNHTTIHEAVNVTSPDDTVVAKEGIYTENVNENEQLTTTDLSAWHYNRTIYIKENSSNDLIDYQVLINLSGNNFPAEANESGADIRFVDENGTGKR